MSGAEAKGRQVRKPADSVTQKIVEQPRQQQETAHEESGVYGTKNCTTANKGYFRRNLNSGQWATIAVEAEELIMGIQAKVEEDRREKDFETRKRREPAHEESGDGEKIFPDCYWQGGR